MTADEIGSELDRLHAEDTSPGMAAVARELAKALDHTDSPTAKAAVARELRSVMADLRRLAPVEQEGDAVNDITRQRAKRRAEAQQRAATGD